MREVDRPINEEKVEEKTNEQPQQKPEKVDVDLPYRIPTSSRPGSTTSSGSITSN